MAGHRRRPLSVLAPLTVLLLGVSLQVAGMVTDYWSVIDQSPRPEIREGLFQYCVSGAGCKSYTDGFPLMELRRLDQDDLTTVLRVGQATALVGLLISGAAMLVTFMTLVHLFSRPHKLLAAAAFAVFGSNSFTALSLIMWGTVLHQPGLASLGFSFYLQVAGGAVVGLAACLALVLAGRMERLEPQTKQ